MSSDQPLSLSQFNQRLQRVVMSQQALQNVWITAETADVRMAGGHCYMELIDKDPQSGKPLAKMKATIWASAYYRIANKFVYETGQTFRSDLKVMVLVTVNFHPVFGLSLNISDINASYTLGDVMQRRNQMIQRLTAEGIINENRKLQWMRMPQRIAIISAQGAAGYGDFINQLYNNASRLRFVTRLFPAVLQGEKTASTIIRALELIAGESESWDCVVIIRGGGASSDLLAFDDYDLAANIAQFPIPVIIGIGHERDITLLDYVANMRVKTPTAAAEWLIQCGEQALGYLHNVAATMLRTVQERLSGCHQQLAFVAGQLPAASTHALLRANQRLSNARIVLATVNDRRIRPELIRLTNYEAQLKQAIGVTLNRASQKLEAFSQLNQALSPQSTLKRGYSITRIGGKAVKTLDDIVTDEVLETILADGTLLSRVIGNIHRCKE